MTRTAVWAVVPVKPFTLAKERLSAMLTAADRARLARVMLQDVLSTLSLVKPALAGVVVVTADRTAAMVAAQSGGVVVDEGRPRGLNGAVRCAVDFLSVTPAVAMMVVPSDLPHLSVHGIARVVEMLQDGPRVVIVPAGCDEGTNILGCSHASVIAPHFGNHSFRRHRDAAHLAGVPLTVIEDDLATCDIDRPADVTQFLSIGMGSATRTLLASLNIDGGHV
jgi:2-phospho-L-lactate guanylyltransferase